MEAKQGARVSLGLKLETCTRQRWIRCCQPELCDLKVSILFNPDWWQKVAIHALKEKREARVSNSSGFVSSFPLSLFFCLCLSILLALSLRLSLILSLSRALALALSLTRSITFSCTHSHSLTHSPTHSLSLSLRGGGNPSAGGEARGARERRRA